MECLSRLIKDDILTTNYTSCKLSPGVALADDNKLFKTIVSVHCISSRTENPSAEGGSPIYSSIILMNLTGISTDISPGGGRGVLALTLGGGVPPKPQNPDPVSDAKIQFSTPHFRLIVRNRYPISDQT